MNNYEDIINLNHYNPRFHPRMSVYNRSAQFAPFAALAGYDDAIVETARLTDNKIELSEDLNQFLDMKLQILLKDIKYRPKVKVRYFEQDKWKPGGKYNVYEGILKNIDITRKELVFVNSFKIGFDYILEIESKNSFSNL